MSVTVIDIAVSFAVAVLAGMGVGGGGLAVIYLVLARQMPQLEAQGINLVFFLSSALPAVTVNLKKRRLDLRRTALIAIPGAVFAVIGSLLAARVNATILRRVFGGLTVIAGLTAIFDPRKRK